MNQIPKAAWLMQNFGYLSGFWRWFLTIRKTNFRSFLFFFPEAFFVFAKRFFAQKILLKFLPNLLRKLRERLIA